MNARELAIVDRLCALSRERSVPLGSAVDWPAERDRDAWYTSPELLSLHGTNAGSGLTSEQQRDLAFHEAVNFYSLNIFGERYLLEGLASRLHKREHAHVSEYLQHFLDEENKHLYYFATFCRRYANKIYPHAFVEFPREYARGEADFLFFAKVLCFEEIVDHYNRKMSVDDRLAHVAREINRLHHLDETRHLAFGRTLVSALFARHAERWSAEVRTRIDETMRAFIGAVWRQYYNPEVYRDAELPEPYALAEAAFDDDAARAHRAQVMSKCLVFLHEVGALATDTL